MRRIALCLTLLFGGLLVAGGGGPASTSVPPSPTVAIDPIAYLTQALDFIEQNALYAERIDWLAERADALERAANADTPADTYPIIVSTLSSLGDNHSSFRTPDQAATNAQDSSLAPTPEGERIGDVGYLIVPENPISDMDYLQRYADAGLNLIIEIDQSPTCGWIIDLRENTGGGLYMVAAIEPLLDEGEVGMSVYESGRRKPWVIQDGALHYEGDPISASLQYDLKQADAPVAVIMSRYTASAGEAVVIAFIGQADARSFGEGTHGVPTVNDGLQMPDGAQIILTQGWMADRSGQTYDGQLQPDQPVDRVWVTQPQAQDNALQAALAWLREEYGCTAVLD